MGVEWWVLMVSIKFIVNPHIIITQHSIPHIINTQHSSPNIHHPTFITPPPTFNPTHHQHPTFNTHHPTFNTQHPINTSSTPNIYHPTPITLYRYSSTPNTQHLTPITLLQSLSSRYFPTVRQKGGVGTRHVGQH